MTSPPGRVSLAALLEIFGQQPADLGQWQTVEPEEVPEPYHTLLVHDAHMTVTVEAHHGSRVNLRTLDVRTERNWYARKILLTRADTGRVVQFGIMRIDFRQCSDAVREAILERETPLGRILIEHDVLRRIDPQTFLRVAPAGELAAEFQLCAPVATYGRLATIYCQDKPAVELLEVVAPEAEDVREAEKSQSNA